MSKAEKFISDFTRNCSNEYLTDGKLDGFGGYISRRKFTPWLTPDQARSVAHIAREETIKEVCEWIKYNNENGGCSFDGWENDLKKHLNSKV